MFDLVGVAVGAVRIARVHVLSAMLVKLCVVQHNRALHARRIDALVGLI